MFNKTYHARARRAGLVSAGQLLEDLALRAADRRRGEKKSKQRAGKLQGVQLELFPEPAPAPADRPLFDLFPQAFE